MCVKNPESIEPLRVLQANYLSCHSSTNAGRRWETLGSEAKDSITHSNNMEFLNFDAKKPSPLMKQMQAQVEKLRKDKESLKAKIKELEKRMRDGE